MVYSLRLYHDQTRNEKRFFDKFNQSGGDRLAYQPVSQIRQIQGHIRMALTPKTIAVPKVSAMSWHVASKQ